MGGMARGLALGSPDFGLILTHDNGDLMIVPVNRDNADRDSSPMFHNVFDICHKVIRKTGDVDDSIGLPMSRKAL